MTIDVIDLRNFYSQRLGAVARRLINRGIQRHWPQADGLRVAGLGYPTPYLGLFREDAERCIALMPAAQGVLKWPTARPTLSTLVDEFALPLADAAIDRILLVHALEEADDPAALLLEAVRALSPTGRIILAAAARGGLWARADNTPFGHGRPFTRRQLERLVRDVGLEPMAWSQTLYVPPWGPMLPLAEGFEQVGRRVFPGTAGLILLEASRHSYARIRPSGHAQRVAAPVLAPQPAASVSSRGEHRG